MKRLHYQTSRLVKYVSILIIVPVVVLVSLLSVKHAHAAGITSVQANQNLISFGNTNSVSFTSNNTVGNLIAVYISWGNVGTVAVTDSNGNTYAAATAVTKWNGATASSEVFYAKNITGGADTVTATFGTAVTNFALVHIDEYGGLSTTNPLDVTSSAIGTAATMNSGSATTTNATDLIYGAGSANIATTAGSGFTSRATTSNNIVGIVEDKPVSTKGSYNSTATQSSSIWVMHMVAFRAATVDTTPPTAPTNVSATATSTSQINLSWIASTDNVGVTGYKIFRNGTQVGTSKTTTYSDTGLSASTTYSYTVSAYDAAGNNSALSGSTSATTQAIPDTSPPTVPTGLTATASSVSQIDVAWFASTDNVGVVGYQIFRNGVQVGASVTPTFSDIRLSAGTTYTYTVSAYDAAGNVSAQSTSVSATTTPTDTTPPSIPTNVSAIATSSTQVNVNWTASTDNVGVTGYEVFRNGTLAGTTASTTYTDTGLTGNTVYGYTIAAYDATGNVSSQTMSISVTTLSVTPGIWTSITPPQISTDFNNPSNSNYGFNSIVMDPTNPDILFMGTDYQGLWKSTNQGATWAKIDTGPGSTLLDEGRLWTLAIDPYNHNTIWTTSGYGAGGPLKSTDGGVSWTLMPVGAPTQLNDVYSIAVDPYTPNHIILAWHYPWTTDGTNSGVSESFDGGVTWTNHQPPAGSNWGAGNTVWFLNNSSTWLFGSQNAGIWRTANSGTSWTQVINDPITHGGVNALSSVSGALYLAHSTSVSKSTDNGVTWTDITSGLPYSYYETVTTDGTNLYTAPSFPIQNYGAANGPWYYMPLSGGTWKPYSSPNTCYTDSGGHGPNCNGPVMGAYDAVNHIAYTVNWLGGVWKIQAP